jgi:hypothetical protein
MRSLTYRVSLIAQAVFAMRLDTVVRCADPMHWRYVNHPDFEHLDTSFRCALGVPMGANALMRTSHWRDGILLRICVLGVCQGGRFQRTLHVANEDLAKRN